MIECLALVRAVGDGRLDRVPIPEAPLDILAQQIVAAVACDDWDEDELFELVRRAYPYRDLSRDDYEAIVDMVSEGIAPERGRFGAYVQRDRVNRRLHARKGARLTAITCGGAIPEIANYRVVTDDENAHGRRHRSTKTSPSKQRRRHLSAGQHVVAGQVRARRRSRRVECPRGAGDRSVLAGRSAGTNGRAFRGSRPAAERTSLAA